VEPVIRLDTHVVVWLFAGDVGRLSPRAKDLIESHRVSISPMVELELTYLFEIGRLALPGAVICADLQDRIGLSLSDTSMSAAVHAASGLSWTRDPFDRLIVGDALATNTSLLTKDNLILTNTPIAVW
jgi:PIN domain nuclease of toxin-antitoxin system